MWFLQSIHQLEHIHISASILREQNSQKRSEKKRANTLFDAGLLMWAQHTLFLYRFLVRKKMDEWNGSMWVCCCEASSAHDERNFLMKKRNANFLSLESLCSIFRAQAMSALSSPLKSFKTLIKQAAEFTHETKNVIKLWFKWRHIERWSREWEDERIDLPCSPPKTDELFLPST